MTHVDRCGSDTSLRSATPHSSRALAASQEGGTLQVAEAAEAAEASE